MKITLVSLSRLLRVCTLLFVAALLATQGTVSAHTAHLAVENAQRDANSLLGKLDQELTRRSSELQASSTALNGESTSSNPSSMGIDAQKCASGDAETAKTISKINQDSARANNSLQMLQESSKQGTNAQQTVSASDAQYDEYRRANFQNNVMSNVCTQKEAQSQLVAQVDQTVTRYNQCFGGNIDLSQNPDWAKVGGTTQTDTSSDATCSQGSQQTGQSGGGGGGSNIDMATIISKVIQLIAAVAAIIVSVIALIQAIQNQDWAVVATLAATIMAQLAAVAEIIIDAISELTQASDSMSDSSGGGSQGSGGSGGSGSTNSGSGSNSNSANLLPVGDGRYTTSGAKKGYVYTCSQYAQRLKSGGGGAEKRGPWFVNNNTQYDPSKKPHVQGQVRWNGTFNNTVSGNTRTIRTNDVPSSHTTGKFPIGTNDPAYQYDRNPNSIKEQSLVYSLPSNPSAGSPQCMGHDVGVMLTGVALFNALDERGRDAGAWETQDACEGHPQNTNKYHYHTLSNCINTVGVRSVIGFALDGFPITGPKADTKTLKTEDLDECHGMTGDVTIDGKTVNTYHYVMTQDFPYSVSCFRASPIRSPTL